MRWQSKLNPKDFLFNTAHDEILIEEVRKYCNFHDSSMQDYRDSENGQLIEVSQWLESMMDKSEGHLRQREETFGKKWWSRRLLDCLELLPVDVNSRIAFSIVQLQATCVHRLIAVFADEQSQVKPANLSKK